MAEPLTYRLAGLVVASDLPLPATPEPVPAAPDVHLVVGGPADPRAADPEGEMVAQLALDGHRYYTAWQTPQGHLLRVHGCADFAVDETCGRVEVRALPGLAPGLAGVLAVGTLAAFLRRLAGGMVLHGSGVALDGVAVGIIGDSGMGKTTVAAQLCAEGAPVLADDVLAVDADGGRPRCHRSGTELRLRPAAADITSWFPPEAVGRTADGRTALRPRAVGAPALPLGLVVVPRPRRDADAVRLTRLEPARALMALARFPRIADWRSAAGRGAEFAVQAHVAQAVPVVIADVPWGPPFARADAAVLVEVLREQLAGRPAQPAVPGPPTR